MKYILIAICASLLTTAAKATPITAVWVKQSVPFHYSSFEDAYSCHYVAHQAKEMLGKLGARDVNVKCHNGLPDYSFVDATLEFSSAVAAEAGDSRGAIEPAMWQSSEIKGREACSFNQAMGRALVHAVGARNVNDHSNCWNSQGTYRFSLEALK